MTKFIESYSSVQYVIAYGDKFVRTLLGPYCITKYMYMVRLKYNNTHMKIKAHLRQTIIMPNWY